MVIYSEHRVIVQCVNVLELVFGLLKVVAVDTFFKFVSVTYVGNVTASIPITAMSGHHST